ncbi:ATP-binding protein [Streptomyces sp. NPDC054838]
MERAAGGEGREAEHGQTLSTSAAYDGGSACIGDARHLAVRFLLDVRTAHGLAVSERAVDMTELVVSELVTNAVKYAPGPIVLDLRISDGAVRVSVWDGDSSLPDVAAHDPQRVGRHGLEITHAVSQAFEVRREPVGKSVTALIALTGDPNGNAADRGAR